MVKNAKNANHGNGKGIANYYKQRFRLTGEVNCKLFQMTKFSSNHCHIINIYRSQGADTSIFLQNLMQLISHCDNCFIVGDFNIDFNQTKDHPIINAILSTGFRQLVKDATHESGSLLDYAFVNSTDNYSIYQHWPYYTDHAAISIIPLF